MVQIDFPDSLMRRQFLGTLAALRDHPSSTFSGNRRGSTNVNQARDGGAALPEVDACVTPPPLKVFVGTYNCGEAEMRNHIFALEGWLPADQDLYVLGLQEARAGRAGACWGLLRRAAAVGRWSGVAMRFLSQSQ